jgi:DTW domain-containing protein YfiP
MCTNCHRPSKACICSFIIKTDNATAVLILQHPSEVKQSKGTVALLQRSLTCCQVIIGEDFSENFELNKLLSNHQVILLFPSEQAQELSEKFNFDEPINRADKSKKKPLLVILDGTWKKAYKMFMLSKNLHALRQVCLPNVLANNGKYLIRKVSRKNALSSLEATCYALALLEGELNNCLSINLDKKISSINCGRYQPILNKFSQFNEFQLSFRNK